MKSEILKKAKAMQPVLRIGKNGLTEGMLSEIKLQLKKKKMIKIKYLRSATGNIQKKEITDRILAETKAELVLSAGNVITIAVNNIYSKV